MVERLAQTGQELLAAQVDVVDRFRGREVFPEPPKDLLEFIEITTEQGYTFEPYLETNLDFSEGANYPGLLHKPNSHFYDLIRRGLLPLDAARLSGPVWAAMEGLQKPKYNGGLQLYDENDPLGPDLEKLRKGGQIEIPDHCKHVPAPSRYGISALELVRYIQPLFAQKSHIDKGQVGNRYAAFLYRGHTSHPEWGETDTAELFTQDVLRDGSRLIGGRRALGGLSDVDGWDAGYHGDGVAFRFRVVFPPEKS